MFSYAYYRDKHLKYTRCVDNGDRKFPCTLCARLFLNNFKMILFLLFKKIIDRLKKKTDYVFTFYMFTKITDHMFVLFVIKHFHSHQVLTKFF